MDIHPDLDRLLAAAEGDPAALAEVSGHVAACSVCRERLAEVRGVMVAVGEELLADRGGCPSPEELASIPPGALRDYPHVAGCSLCREEVGALHALAAWHSVERAWVGGAPVRSEWTEGARSALLQSGAGAALSLDLREGARTSGDVSGARVTLRVAGGRLNVVVAGEPSTPLTLRLESEVLTRRLGLRTGEHGLAVGAWLRAYVAPEAEKA